MSSLCRGHANLLCIVPIFSYVTPKGTMKHVPGSGAMGGVLHFVELAGYGRLRDVSKTRSARLPGQAEFSGSTLAWHSLLSVVHLRRGRVATISIGGGRTADAHR